MESFKEILDFVFFDFWHFIGSFMLLGLMFRGITLLIHGYPKADEKDEDIEEEL